MSNCAVSFLRKSALLVLCFSIATACRPPATVFLEPQEVVAQSVQRMKILSGFRFSIDRTGGLAFIDSSQSLAFRRAEGDFVAPDRAQATIRVIAPGLVTEVEIVSIGDIQWETHPLTGSWQQLPPNWGFNPASLFDAETGIQPLLETDLSDLGFVGFEELEEVPGVALIALEGQMAGDRLNRLSFGLLNSATKLIKLWIMPETYELYRLRIIEPAQTGDEDRVWQVDFWNFDQEVEIVPPVTESDG